MDTLTWNKVESSNIDALAHDGQKLLVRFNNGAVYECENVPEAVFLEIKDAASVGRTFNSLVKSRPDE